MTFSRQGAQGARVAFTPSAYVPGPISLTGSGGISGAGQLANSGPAVAPPDVTTAVPATKMIGVSTFGHFNASNTPGSSVYDTWKAQGFGGYAFTLGGTAPMLTQLMRGSTGVGGSSSYDWMQAMEGMGVPSINGVAYGVQTGPFYGPKRAVARDPTIDTYLWDGQFVPGAMDSSGDAAWAAYCTRMAGHAAGMNFFGGKGLYWDFEVPGWTASGTLAQVEARGYQVGTAVYSNFQAANIMFYFPVPGGTFFDAKVYNSTPSSNSTSFEMQFLYGVLRAGADLGATGRFAYLDHHLGYRFDTGGVTVDTYTTAIKWSTQGMLAEFSTSLPAASRDYWMSKIDYRLYTWGQTDNTTFYKGNELSVAEYNAMLELARQWSMGGSRTEFCNSEAIAGNGTRPDGIQGVAGSRWVGHNPYTFPTGRPAGLIAATSTDASYSTTVPVLSASSSGSGTTRTITGSASHAFGIRYVKAYVYPSGTPVAAVMTFNTHGGTPSTGITSSTQDYTLGLTGVSGATPQAIVTAYSTLGQEHSVVVNL